MEKKRKSFSAAFFFFSILKIGSGLPPTPRPRRGAGGRKSPLAPPNQPSFQQWGPRSQNWNPYSANWVLARAWGIWLSGPQALGGTWVGWGWFQVGR